MFSFHVGPGLDILFEKLTAQIGSQLGLGTLLCFKTLVTFGLISLNAVINIGLVRLSHWE